MVSKTIPIRLDDDLVARLDALAAALTERAAGVKVTRTAAMRTALERGIAALESEVGPVARRKPKRK
jgi:predicted transcriptional regulator